MTRKGKFVNPAAKRYLDYKGAVGWEVKKHLRMEAPLSDQVHIGQITYIMPMPKTGKTSVLQPNGKRKALKVHPGDWHLNKPDIDNLFKGFADALNGILWRDDSLICEVGTQRKIYGEIPGIEFEVMEG